MEKLAARLQAADIDFTFHIYTGTGHWFFEDDVVEASTPEPALLAWERNLAFLQTHLRSSAQALP